MKRFILYTALTVLVLTSCGSYQTLLKSGDYNEKYIAAKNYFLEKDYVKSATLLSDISTHFRGTREAEELLYLLAESYMGQEDYYLAAEYYSSYIKSYPRGMYVQNCRFMIGYCYYLDSPDPRLDQSKTHQAIASFNEFVTLYPQADRTSEAYIFLGELYDKLAYKGFLNAKLYLNLGTYMGNNYKSAIIVAENTLKDYPSTTYREQLSFIILDAKYKEAALSIPEKRNERYSEVIDEYYKYAVEFPNGKNIKEANRILQEAKRHLQLN